MMLQHSRQKICMLMALLGFFLAGCSQTTIPLAEAPPLYSQYKIQSVDHWDTIAEAAAVRIQKSFEDRPDIIAKPVYIIASHDGAFTRAFAVLLRSQLVCRGMQVSEQPEPDAIILNFTATTVAFNGSRGDFGLSLAGLGLGLGASIAGAHASASDHEVVITTSMTYRNRYVMSLSQICYINDDDWALYFDRQKLKNKEESVTAVWKKYALRGQAFPQQGMPVSPYTTVRLQPVNSSSYIPGQPWGQPIIEEYVMPSGARKIDPSAPPTPIGRRKR